jgi:hypothetical protein
MNAITVSCPKCHKEFEGETEKQANARLTCHNMRVHTKAGKTARLLALRSRMKNKQERLIGLNGVSDESPKVAPKNVWRGKPLNWTTEELDILDSIVRGYHVNGKVSLRRAYEENPEWRKKLSGRKATSIYSKITALISKNSEGSFRQSLPPSQNVQITPPSVKLTYCYTCALDIELISQVVGRDNVKFCPRCRADFQIFQMVGEISNLIN